MEMNKSSSKMLQMTCKVEGSSSQMLQIAWKIGTARNLKNKSLSNNKKIPEQFPTRNQLREPCR